jgi:hypothetical protein
MSVLGQTEKSGRSTGKSALPPRTDVASRACQVRKVPNPDIQLTGHTNLSEDLYRGLRSGEIEVMGKSSPKL